MLLSPFRTRAETFHWRPGVETGQPLSDESSPNSSRYASIINSPTHTIRPLPLFTQLLEQDEPATTTTMSEDEEEYVETTEAAERVTCEKRVQEGLQGLTLGERAGDLREGVLASTGDEVRKTTRENDVDVRRELGVEARRPSFDSQQPTVDEDFVGMRQEKTGGTLVCDICRAFR
jgi:hypothetical protein